MSPYHTDGKLSKFSCLFLLIIVIIIIINIIIIIIIIIIINIIIIIIVIMNKHNQKPIDMFNKQDVTVYLTYSKIF